MNVIIGPEVAQSVLSRRHYIRGKEGLTPLTLTMQVVKKAISSSFGIFFLKTWCPF